MCRVHRRTTTRKNIVSNCAAGRLWACDERCVPCSCSSAHGTPARALLCPGSIGRACKSGMFSVAQLEYMRASRESCDARDVVWHRAVTKLVDAREDRAANNEIMHALDVRVAVVAVVAEVAGVPAVE